MTDLSPHHQKKYDMLRGVAAIAVLLPHAAATFLERLLGPRSPMAEIGQTVARHAVLVFFLLSGYLITQSVVSNMRRNGCLDVKEYLAARIARIYPPLIGAITLVLTIWVIVHAFDLPGRNRYGLAGDLFAVRDFYAISVKDVGRALLMQDGMLDADGPLWTLYIEFHIYLIAMFFAMALDRRRRLLWAVFGSALMIYCIHIDSQFAFFGLIWAMGAAANLAGSHLVKLRAHSIAVPIVYALGAALLVAGITSHRLFAVDNSDVLLQYGVQLACCLIYVDAIFLNDRIGTNPPKFLVRTGDFSYSLYVIHFPLLLLTLSLTQSWVGYSLIRATVTALAASVTTVVAAAWFARFFEDQRRFKPHIRAAINAIGNVAKRRVPAR